MPRVAHPLKVLGIVTPAAHFGDADNVVKPLRVVDTDTGITELAFAVVAPPAVVTNILGNVAGMIGVMIRPTHMIIFTACPWHRAARCTRNTVSLSRHVAAARGLNRASAL